MKIVSIDKDACIGCGMCAALAEAIFAMDDDGLAEVILSKGELTSPEMVSSAEEARLSCPTAAIQMTGE